MPSQHTGGTTGPTAAAAEQRRVPMLMAGRLLFGDGMAQFGWLAIAVILVIAFPYYLADSLRSVSNALSLDALFSVSKTPGVVLRVEPYAGETYATHYRFEPAAVAGSVEGVAYLRRRAAVGDIVTVSYYANNPATSWIPEARSGPDVDFCLMLWLLLIVGLGVAAIVPGFRRGGETIRVLVTGTPARGRLRVKEPTNAEIGGQTVYHLLFRFQGSDGREHEASASLPLTAELENERGGAHILYDPADPGGAVVLEALPGPPRLGPDDRLIPGNPLRYLRRLLLPALVVFEAGLLLAGLLLG